MSDTFYDINVFSHQKEVDSSIVILNIFKVGMEVGSALIDLDASVNIISLSVIQKFGNPKIQLTVTTRQMGDKTCMKPIGTIKDVRVKINNFSFPIDFMVLDIEETQKYLSFQDEYS